jgi:hypothetical protein
MHYTDTISKVEQVISSLCLRYLREKESLKRNHYSSLCALLIYRLLVGVWFAHVRKSWSRNCSWYKYLSIHIVQIPWKPGDVDEVHDVCV